MPRLGEEQRGGHRKKQRQGNGERQLGGEEEESEQSENRERGKQSWPLRSSVLTSASRERNQNTSNLKATGSHGKTGAAWSRDVAAEKLRAPSSFQMSLCYGASCQLLCPTVRPLRGFVPLGSDQQRTQCGERASGSLEPSAKTRAGEEAEAHQSERRSNRRLDAELRFLGAFSLECPPQPMVHLTLETPSLH